MNAASKIETPTGLALLRQPFPAHQISKLPKETKAQADARKTNREGVNCTVCGGWHHPRAVHLDYVGHAALTDRLLDTDPNWTWEPLAFTAEGLPAFDRTGGLWIKLTVCGQTRIGFGCADGKSGGDAVKEIIGDALRNAAMRFGAALDLWHKGDLHADDGDDPAGGQRQTEGEVSPRQDMPDAEWAQLVQLIKASKADTKAMLEHFKVPDLRKLSQVQYAEAIDALKTKLAKAAKAETDAKAKNELAEALNDEITF